MLQLREVTNMSDDYQDDVGMSFRPRMFKRVRPGVDGHIEIPARPVVTRMPAGATKDEPKLRKPKTKSR